MAGRLPFTGSRPSADKANNLIRSRLRRAGLVGNNRREIDVSIRHTCVISLQVDGTGSRGIGKNCTSGRASHWLVVDHLFAVQNNGDMSVNERQVVSLPLSSRLSRILGRRNSPKDGSDALDSLHPAVAVDHLSLVHAAQINATVACFSDKEFNMQPKVFKLCFGAQIGVSAGRAKVCLGGRIDE